MAWYDIRSWVWVRVMCLLLLVQVLTLWWWVARLNGDLVTFATHCAVATRP